MVDWLVEQKAERMVLKTAGRMVALTELKLVDQWVWMWVAMMVGQLDER